MRSYWISIDRKSNDWCLYLEEKGEEDSDTTMWTHREKMMCEDRGSDWSDVATSQGMPRVSGNHQRLGRSKEGFLPGAFGESMAHQ